MKTSDSISASPLSAKPAAIRRHEWVWTALAVALLAYALTLFATPLPGSPVHLASTRLALLALMALAVGILLPAIHWAWREVDTCREPWWTPLVVATPAALAWWALVERFPAAAGFDRFTLLQFAFSWIFLGILLLGGIKVWRRAEPTAEPAMIAEDFTPPDSPVARRRMARTTMLDIGPRPLWREYLGLMKLGLNGLVLFTTFIGFYLGSARGFNATLCLATMVGTALVAAGSSVLNQFIERDTDRLMRRTARRPLPAGRLRPRQAIAYGIGLCLAGAYVLLFHVNILALFLTILTLAVYLFLYTPLKRINSLSTLAGGISGALPPVIGYAAAAGGLEPMAIVLFLILFLWQEPHFLAIAWKYREQYGRAGFPLLSVGDDDARASGRQSVLYAAALLIVGMLPVVQGQASQVYGVGAALLGGAMLGYAVAFRLSPSTRSAMQLFFASIVYLPLLLTMLLIDRAFLS